MFTFGYLCARCLNKLWAFAMWSAFQTSDYYAHTAVLRSGCLALGRWKVR